ncbi:MAG: hypothetical protein K9K66_16270 [Desulfarculaceae bacterium]|nr:hypothetical protein [Desulfarculaceae bacterium]MCF8073352.1 hypothetical protein [Desulfarculaceae bacterium]MCF8103212.1 hypothetical protein [Desulfarculaceae bacterium]MCF8118217.1 hypothetical protein [Desulfarculaceae bacterium]
MRAALIMALTLALLLAAIPATAESDVLAGPQVPLPGPKWKLYDSRGVSLAIPARWYGFFYVGMRPLYAWWARKTGPLYTEMEFALFEMDGPPTLGRQGQVDTKALGPATLAGLPAQAFDQSEMAGTEYARRRLILVLERPLVDGKRLWAVADSDAQLWEQTRAWRESILASLRFEPFFFVLGSQWRFVEKGGVYFRLPWSWRGGAVNNGYAWSGALGQGQTMAVGWRKGPAPDLKGWTLQGRSRIGKYPCAVYERRVEKRGKLIHQRLALVDEPLEDRRRIWLVGELSGSKGEREWQELGPALNAMLRDARIDWELF